MSTTQFCAIGQKCICAQNCVLLVNIQSPRRPMLQKLSTDVNKYSILSMPRANINACKEELSDKNDQNAAMIQIHTHLPQEEGVILCHFQFTVHLANA